MSSCYCFSPRAMRSLCLPESQAVTGCWASLRVEGSCWGTPTAAQGPWVPLGACLGWGSWGGLCVYGMSVAGGHRKQFMDGVVLLLLHTYRASCCVCLRCMQPCPLSAPRDMSSLLDLVESHRVTESLENTPKIIKSNHQSHPHGAVKPCPQVPRCVRCGAGAVCEVRGVHSCRRCTVGACERVSGCVHP